MQNHGTGHLQIGFSKIVPLITRSNAAIAPVRWTIFSGEKSNLSALS